MTPDEATRARLHQIATVDSGAPDFMLTMGINYGQMRKALGAVLDLCADNYYGPESQDVMVPTDIYAVIATALGVDT